MPRGNENQPKHMTKTGTPKFVAYEQSKHRSVSRANKAGYAKGRGGPRSWQSHHIVCLSTLGDRQAKDEPTARLLEDTLFETPWNVNEAPNMIGLPMYRLYVKAYQGSRSELAWRALSPRNLPAHDIDHNTRGGYTDEVKDYLRDRVWKTFAASEKDHDKTAEWLHKKLEQASSHFQRVLLARGQRPKGAKSGTASCWRERFDNEDWAAPFSMADEPSPRHPGVSWTVLDRIFEALGL